MSFEKLLPSGLKPDPDLTLPHIDANYCVKGMEGGKTTEIQRERDKMKPNVKVRSDYDLLFKSLRKLVVYYHSLIFLCFLMLRIF